MAAAAGWWWVAFVDTNDDDKHPGTEVTVMSTLFPARSNRLRSHPSGSLCVRMWVNLVEGGGVLFREELWECFCFWSG